MVSNSIGKLHSGRLSFFMESGPSGGSWTRLLLYLYLYLYLFFISSECLFGVTKRYIFYPHLTYFLNLSFLHYYFQIFWY